jgi:CHAT domain-containing protein
VIKTTNQLASEYFRLGNYVKSLDLHQQSLAAASAISVEPMQLWRNYFAIAMPLEAMGLHAAAIEYEKEALRRAEAMKQSTEISRSYSILGLMYAGEGRYAEAIRSATEAIGVARTIPGERSRQEALAYSTLQMGFIYRASGDFGKAISNYDQALDSYRKLDKFEAFSYVAHKGKLLSCIKQPGCVFVEEEIKSCLDLFKQYRANIREQSNRLPFFDTEQDIYDIATEYEFSRQNYQLSFEYSEQGRASILRELSENKAKMISGASGPDIELKTTSPPLSFSEIQAAIPANTQVLQYAVMRDKTVIWLISNTEFLHEEKPITFAGLNEILDRYLRVVTSPATTVEDVALDGAALYDILIRPIERGLKKDKLLCIVPDKTLNYLPFAALVPVAGRYFINDFKIVMAPSSSMFITSSLNASDKESVASESLLSVGNPHFSRDQFPHLDDLPSAEREAREIDKFYDRSRASLLLNWDARKPLVMAKMKTADVVHLAMHSIVDEHSPLRSRLILAEADASDQSSEKSILQAYEIYQAGMPVTRLVVLSACDTGVGRYYGGEGTMGLSRTFMAAGVPLVVASLWSVDSDPTADFMIEFHRLRRVKKLSTAEAIQKTQEQMAFSTDSHYRHPYYWAGFTVAGGDATF